MVRPRVGRSAAIAFAAIAGLCASCTSAPVYPTNATACGGADAPPARYQHIVVVMEENRTWNDVGGPGFKDPDMPFLRDAGAQCTTFADWTETNTGQSSLSQYVGLTSGVNNSSTIDDCEPSKSCRSTDNNIFRQVRRSGGTARSYVEGATAGCSDHGNAVRHVPAMYYYGSYTDDSGAHNDHDFCESEVRPLAELDVDNLPTFAMITPDTCNDGHDCDNDVVDRWAHATLQPILDSSAYAAGTTAIFVVYDEDQPVPNLVMAPTAKRGVQTIEGAGHAAALRTWEEMLELPIMPVPLVTEAISLRGPANI